MGGRQAVLGLDLGTTIVKAVILDGDGTVLASGASQRLHTNSPLPNRAEQDPAQVWTSVDGTTWTPAPSDAKVPGFAFADAAVKFQSGLIVAATDTEPTSHQVLLRWTTGS